MKPETTRKMTLVNSHVEETYGAPRPRKRKFGDDDGMHIELPAAAGFPSFESSTAPAAPAQTITSTLEVPDAPIQDDIDDDLDAIPTFEHLANAMIHDADELNRQIPIIYHGDDALLLRNLFHYPTQTEEAPTALSFMTDFWGRGERGLRVEEQYHEAALRQLIQVADTSAAPLGSQPAVPSQ